MVLVPLQCDLILVQLAYRSITVCFNKYFQMFYIKRTLLNAILQSQRLRAKLHEYLMSTTNQYWLSFWMHLCKSQALSHEVIWCETYYWRGHTFIRKRWYREGICSISNPLTSTQRTSFLSIEAHSWIFIGWTSPEVQFGVNFRMITSRDKWWELLVWASGLVFPRSMQGIELEVTISLSWLGQKTLSK